MSERKTATYRGYGNWTFECPNCGYTSHLDDNACSQCREPFRLEVVFPDADES